MGLDSQRFQRFSAVDPSLYPSGFATTAGPGEAAIVWMAVLGFNRLANTDDFAAQHIFYAKAKGASQFENLLLSLRLFFNFAALDFTFYVSFQGNQCGKFQFGQIHEITLLIIDLITLQVVM
ncbi:hypothetical protein BI344_12450 [Chromobacterium sphagni]|uniref:Uncharacterized protein n=1 Tax=Chromobacterium sphagni TaxID=1903179 RepID=A0ABX3C7G2_9NEIS|nr:hypothetical protein BI344_12450 [Chromobacterium sphagni]